VVELGGLLYIKNMEELAVIPNTEKRNGMNGGNVKEDLTEIDILLLEKLLNRQEIISWLNLLEL